MFLNQNNAKTGAVFYNGGVGVVLTNLVRARKLNYFLYRLA
jgi:hypothetical protein